MSRQKKRVDQFQQDYATGLMLPTRRLFLPRWMNVHNPGCCGCGAPTCILFTDNFTRADSTSLGSDWTEVFGQWEIISNTLRVTSAFIPAILVSASAPSQQEYSMTWSYTNATSGDKIRTIFGYTDTSNFYFAELQLTSSTAATIKLYHKSGGSDTLLSTSSSFAVVSGAGSLNICYNGTFLSASAPGFTGSYVSSVISVPAGTEKFGLSVVNPVTTSDMRFILVEVKKVEIGCELCRPGNCCNVDETGPIPRPICCMFDEFGPPITMSVHIEGAYDSDPVGNIDCPWCGNDPTVGDWIVTNSSTMPPHYCGSLLQNPCFLYYDHGIVLGPHGCIGGQYWCQVYTMINFVWIDVCSTYRIVVIQQSIGNVSLDDCTAHPCGSDGSLEQWMRWYKDFSWPSGGINAASLGMVTLDPDASVYTGTAAAGSNSICSYTNALCEVEFLT